MANIRRILVNRSLWLALTVSGLFTILLIWSTVNSIRDFTEYHKTIAVESTASVAKNVHGYIEERQRLVNLFSRLYRDDIHELVRDPENLPLYDALDNKVKDFFPESFSFTIADEHGMPFFTDYDGIISDLCEADIKQYSHERKYAPYIHPNVIQYHFDIMQNVDLDGAKGIFFVSFKPDVLGRFLKVSESPGHQLILVRPDLQLLLEATSLGARDNTPRDDFRLTKMEQERFLQQLPIENTRWSVVDLQATGLISDFVYMQWVKAVAVLVTVLTIIMVLTWLLNREHEALKKRDRELEKYKTSLEELVVARTIELQRHIDELERHSYAFAHDLRTPVRSIVSFSQIVLEDTTTTIDAQSRENLERVIKAGSKMAVLLDNMNQLTSASRSAQTIEAIDLSALAQEVAEQLRNSNGNQGTVVQIEPGIQLYGDKNAMRELLYQLFDNAFRYARQAKAPCVSFGCEKNREAHNCFVRNNGPGIDLAYAKNIFRPFESLEPSSDLSNTGIGLALVKQIVERHHGKVWVESTPGNTSFHFTTNVGADGKPETLY